MELVKKVIEVEDEAVNTIYKTYDYSKFTLDCENREVKDKNINKILKSLGIKNLLSSYPIMVNNVLSILDGQNRFTAAKRMGLPIYYFIQNNITIRDIPHCSEATTSWKPNDYLLVFMKRGIKSYVEIYKLIQKISYLTARTVLQLSTSHKRSEITTLFKNGDFIFSKKDKKNIVTTCYYSNIIHNALTSNNSLTTTIACHQVNFLIAIKRIIRTNNFSHKIFREQIKKYPGKILKCSTTDEYTFILEALYNHRLKTSKRIRYV